MNGMETGDRVLILLGAKLACCVLLGLAAAGVLGGLGLFLTTGIGRWVVAGIVVALIAWVVFARRRRPWRKQE
ncbi:MAG: hypothetical protein HYY38_00680 [Rhodospirillales bacterium]|nr:hypothetical protein [Rhodospirillales bacterium]